jgi:hypothetical protein
MLHFPTLRTRRLTVQLRELSIGESISIAGMPSHLEEATTTAFLRKAVESVQGIDDPANWTVQERIMAVCHYLASVSDDGPDFSVGENGKYLDYLDGAIDEPATLENVEICTIGGDVWQINHLTGAMAESIERLCDEIDIDGSSRKARWFIGGMAAQLTMKGEDVPKPSGGEGAFDDFLLSRMRVIAAYPESDFAQLMSGYLDGRNKLHHLFRIEFANDGIVVMPTEGGVARGLSPARFPAHNCVSELAKNLVGESNEHGRQS